MKKITLITLGVIMIVSAAPTSSVGGPMTIVAILLVAAWTVGLDEAWSSNRGAGGWTVSVVMSVLGSAFAMIAFGMAIDQLLSHLQFEGSLVSSHRAMFPVAAAAAAVVSTLGSWSALQIANRLRSRMNS